MGCFDKMARATLKDIEGALKTFNGIIEESGFEVVLGQRYGYKALDLYRRGGGVKKTLQSGMTSSEVLNYIWAMVEGIKLISGRA